MNQYAVQSFFRQFPKLEKCFETFDGILFATPEAAKAYLKGYPNKSLKEHKNPAFQEAPVKELTDEEKEFQELERQEKIENLKTAIAQYQQQISAIDEDSIGEDDLDLKHHLAELKGNLAKCEDELQSLEA